MASARTRYAPLPIKQHPPRPVNDTPETRYWKKFKVQVTAQHHAAVTDIHFSSADPTFCAATASTRVIIYNSVGTVSKTITRFKDIAYGGTFRADGKLVVAGGKHPVVQLFDVGTRSVLRQFSGHNKPVHVTKFAANKTHVYSAADDHSVRMWDIPAAAAVHVTENAHKDYIRTGYASVSSPHLFATGGYDHMVKLWDMRAKDTCVATFDQGAPVESIVLNNSGALLFSCGGTEVKVWDLLTGNKDPLHTMENHRKTVTGLALSGDSTRLLSVGLDHQVKVYGLQDYEVMYGFKADGPILSAGISPDDSRLAIGTASGVLTIRQKMQRLDQDESDDEEDKKKVFGGTARFFQRGKNALPASDDYVVESKRKQRLQLYDRLLKKFQYGKALDAALSTKRPVVVASMFEELIQRRGLRAALKGRDDIHLEPILVFVNRHITNPRYSTLLIDVCQIILDEYTQVIGQSMLIDDLLVKLQTKLKLELKFQKELFELTGVLDMLGSVSAVSSDVHTGK